MNRSRLLVTFSVLLVLVVFMATPLAADPVVNTFKISAKVSSLTAGRKYAFTFRLFDAAAGGIPLFEEVKTYTVPSGKTISHQLGSVNLVQPLLAEDFLQQLWVEVSVPNKAPFPRIRLEPTPLAIGSQNAQNAQNADMLDDQHAADFALVGHTHGSGPAMDADTLDGQHGAYYQDAGNLSGTLGDSRLSGNVALLDAAQTVTGARMFNPPGGAAPFAVHASNTAVVTNLNADHLDGQQGSDYRNAANLNSGALSTDRYSAHGDLVAEGYLGDAGGDIARNNGVLQPTLYAQRAQSADALGGAALSALDVRYRTASLVQGFGGYKITTADASGTGGADSSIGVTIGADGLPVIAYVDMSIRQLKVFHCTDATCASGTGSLVASTGTDGWDTAITIGADGRPVIANFDDNTSDLLVIRCGNAACSSGNTLVTLDSAGSVGWNPSITIGTDGLPVISYWDASNNDLKVYHCGAADCSAGTAVAADTAGNVGGASSIVIGTNGLPVVSYWDSTNQNLKLLLCGDAACTAGNTILTADNSGTVGSFNSVIIGADGMPVVAYYDQSNKNLKVLHCGNAACSAGNTATTVAGVTPVFDVGQFPSITVDANGLPVISYLDNTNLNLNVLHCGDAACSSANTWAAPDRPGSVGWNTSITSDADGLPLIAYWDFTNGDLKVARRFIRTLGRR